MSRIYLAYIAGAYSAPTPHEREINIQDAWRLGAEVAALGVLPVVPHMMSAHLDALQPQEWWLAATLELMRKCDVLVLLPSWRRSTGTQGERLEAEGMGMPVLHGVDDLKLWLRGRA